MAHSVSLNSSCLCGLTSQAIRTRGADPRAHNYGATISLTQDLYLCHCVVCQKMSGELWGSYIGCERPPNLKGLARYEFKKDGGKDGTSEKRWFCERCGGHLFRWTGSVKEVQDVMPGEGEYGEDTGGRWEVATGTLEPIEGIDPVRFAGHVNLAQPVDGGAAVWLQHRSKGGSMAMFSGEGPDYYTGESSDRFNGLREQDLLQKSQPALQSMHLDNEAEKDHRNEILKAVCFCGTVDFHITRPNTSSRLPRSNFPDLMIPYHTQDPRIQNPKDEKWWLRGYAGAETKYLAGTCACTSCRLASGCEIQTWAFVPRSNIFFHTSRVEKGKDREDIPLDFKNKVFENVLKSYESSEGVVREFCGKCGATVFWHDKWRPDLIDVSVGLLDAPEGKRAESWLDWWTERVSFREDAVGHGKVLVEMLEKGISVWGGNSS